MAITRFGDFVEVDHSSTLEYRWFLVTQQYREKETVTFESPVTDASTWPASPLNPGSLGSAWKCDSRQLVRQYGVLDTTVYRETWVLTGAWTNVQ